MKFLTACLILCFALSNTPMSAKTQYQPIPTKPASQLKVTPKISQTSVKLGKLRTLLVSATIALSGIFPTAAVAQNPYQNDGSNYPPGHFGSSAPKAWAKSMTCVTKNHNSYSLMLTTHDFQSYSLEVTNWYGTFNYHSGFKYGETYIFDTPDGFRREVTPGKLEYDNIGTFDVSYNSGLGEKPRLTIEADCYTQNQ